MSELKKQKWTELHVCVPREHFICLIKHKQLHVIQLKRAALNHIVHAPGRANDNVHTILFIVGAGCFFGLNGEI